MSDTGCLLLEPDIVGRILCGDWAIDSCAPMACAPTGGGQQYDIPSGPGSEAAFYAALAAMNGTGGNVINFLPGPHEGEYRVRGDNIVGGGTAPDGVPGNHNCITGEPGHLIDSQGFGIDPTLAFPAIDIAAANHWNVIGLNIQGSGFYGIRYMLSENTAASPALIFGNTVTGTSHGGINVRGWFQALPGSLGVAPWGGEYWGESSHVRIECNTIGGNKPDDAEPDEFREGIYVGAFPEWVDTTHDVLIARNDIFDMTAELIEAKSGSYRVFVEDNLLHDSIIAVGTNTTSIPVGHLVLHWLNSPPPAGHPAADPQSHALRNRLWNLGHLAGGPRYPIVLGGGGMTAEANIGWSNQQAEFIAVDGAPQSGTYGPGTKIIRCNSSDGTTYVVDPDNNGWPQATSITANVPTDAAVSVIGPITGTADAGEGPGSGFAPVAPCTIPGPGCTDATGSCVNDCAGALIEDQR